MIDSDVMPVRASALRLRPLRLGDEVAVRTAQHDMEDDSFEFALDLATSTDWPNHLAAGRRIQCGADLSSEEVPATFLLATIDDVIVGRTSIRHDLNDWLLAFGGHVGYGVLPPFRRQGCATEILRQSLIVARSLGVDRVLLTCDYDNVASSTVIERMGGALDPDWPRSGDPSGGAKAKRRYWIE